MPRSQMAEQSSFYADQAQSTLPWVVGEGGHHDIGLRAGCRMVCVMCQCQGMPHLQTHDVTHQGDAYTTAHAAWHL